MPRIFFAVLFSLLSLAGTDPVRAAPILFDFEGEAITFNPPPTRTGALTSLSMTEMGLTVDITRPGASFDIVGNTGSQTKAAAFGTKSLDPFLGQRSNTPFWADFSTGLTSLSVDFGDYGADTDTLSLQVFSGLGGTGVLLGSATDLLTGGGTAFSFKTLTVTTGLAFRSARLIGGSGSFPNSVFVDNLRANRVVPEPTSLAQFTLLVACAGAYRVRRRS